MRSSPRVLRIRANDTNSNKQQLNLQSSLPARYQYKGNDETKGKGEISNNISKA